MEYYFNEDADDSILAALRPIPWHELRSMQAAPEEYQTPYNYGIPYEKQKAMERLKWLYE